MYLALCRLAEGRQPWTLQTGIQPEQELTDAESGIWALAGPPTPGGLILGGTEDGTVLAWDARSPELTWQVTLHLFTDTGTATCIATRANPLTGKVLAAGSLTFATSAVSTCEVDLVMRHGCEWSVLPCLGSRFPYRSVHRIA